MSPSVGTQLCTSLDKSDASTVGIHASTASLHRVLRSAFSGARDFRHIGLSNSEHSSVVILAWNSFRHAQGTGLMKVIRDLKSGQRRCVTINRAWGETFIVCMMSAQQHAIYLQWVLDGWTEKNTEIF